MEIGLAIRRMLSKRLRGSVAFILVVTSMSLRAETNSWIKATSGAWEETNSWSLGILPDSSQSVVIPYPPGGRTVTISAVTTQNYSNSLTVNDLTLDDTVLVLNDSGAVPLRVLKSFWLLNYGEGLFAQTNGNTFVSEDLHLNGWPQTQARPGVILDGGVLGCSNLVDSAMSVLQASGSLIVSNLLFFSGGGARYTFAGGTMSARNIELGAEFLIGPSTQSGRISNPGYFKLTGQLLVDRADEHLGVLKIEDYSYPYPTIAFVGSESKLSFENSSAENWGVFRFVITNWNGSFEGGGDTQLKFGNNATGLTSTQLLRTVFLNPVGVENGEYAARILATGEVVPVDKNYWTKSTGGNWDEMHWSLGTIPNYKQSVLIVNDGAKTVFINATIAQAHPESLTVNDLFIAGTNTLLLNSLGTSISFRALNGLTLSNATLLSIDSSVSLENGVLNIKGGGDFIQNGGLVQTRDHAIIVDQLGKYSLIKGILEGGSLLLGNGYTGFFDQSGGIVRVSAVSVKANSFVGSVYHLYGGELNVSNSLGVGSDWGNDRFYHHDGTNRIGGSLSIGSGQSEVDYIFENGLLCSSNVFISAWGERQPARLISSGVQVITNKLEIEGTYYAHPSPVSKIPATYSVSNGFLSAQSLVLFGPAYFSQQNATTIIAGTVQFIAPTGDTGGCLSIGSGTFTCGDVNSSAGVIDIVQSGGAFVVSNLFLFGGYYSDTGYYGRTGENARYAQYNFSGGTLTASNIELAAEMIVGSSAQSGRITNPGYFKMSGTLTSGDATEQLGRFILASNSVIDLGDGSAKLSFTNSSAESWDGAAKLFVTNWNGSLTGGGDDQLRFGNDASALTAGKLNQIRFVNPTGFPPGEFLAQILDTGEVVPKPSPAISFGQSGTNFVLSWSSDFICKPRRTSTGLTKICPARRRLTRMA
jgi:hypothetical protein